MRLYSPAINVILDPVKRQFGAQKLKDVFGHVRGDVRLKVQQVKVWLVIDLPAQRGGQRRHVSGDGLGPITYRMGIRRMF